MGLLDSAFTLFGGAATTVFGEKGDIGSNVGVSVQGGYKQQFINAASLPGTVSGQDVINKTAQASLMGTQLKLMRQYVQASNRVMGAIAGHHEAAAQHQANVMRHATGIARTDARHAVNTMAYQHAVGVQKAEVSGADKAYNDAKSQFNF
jgi:hypothetical protein